MTISTKQPNRFNHSLVNDDGTITIALCEEHERALKYHFKNALKDFIGVAEAIAGWNPTRFVFAEIPHFIKTMSKPRKAANASRTKYGERMVKYSKAKALELKIISKAKEKGR